ncbi:hypothetical protein [Streptomyces griseorubiginosus]|uniref:hypothetical protein n=1 Tax=Streptomyces griseorubiginosus TaxID=67304 RepID=UPI00076D84BB|nr:hypothetical protein [Streptomyces griseorubiginosus]KUM70246.1 hypothetical protein AQI84_30790 [Streptomyces griseorubiginosus]
MSAGPTGEIYRIDWLPGTDTLHGTCHCGREHTAQDPIEMWEWMLAHPQGHEPPASEPQGHEPSACESQGHEPRGGEPRGTEPRGHRS